MVAIRGVWRIARSRDHQNHLIHGSETKRLPTSQVSPKKLLSHTHRQTASFFSFFFFFPCSSPFLSFPPSLDLLNKNNITNHPINSNKPKNGRPT